MNCSHCHTVIDDGRPRWRSLNDPERELCQKCGFMLCQQSLGIQYIPGRPRPVMSPVST